MFRGAYLLLSVAQGNICSNVASLFPMATESLKLLSGVIGLVVLIIGVRLINDLYLRGVDAICGFHAMLGAQLKRLERVAWQLGKTKKENAQPQHSVFMHFCNDKTKEELEKADRPFEDIDAFISCVNDVIQIFEKSGGQVPLSPRMYDEMKRLHLTLLDIAAVSNLGISLVLDSMDPSSSVLASPKDVSDKAKAFDKNINSILKEIDVRTEKMLKRLWRKLKTKKEKSSN